jgi:hypothetical protein
MLTPFDDILERRHCERQVRLFGFLWHVPCGGTLEVRPSRLRPSCVYAVCERCGDVSWPPQIPKPAGLKEKTT